MKSKDIGMIIVVAFVSAIFAIVISNFAFAGSKNRNMTAEVVEPISAEFKTPDQKYFNKDSINPTKNITIGDGSNQTPFVGE